MQTLEATVNTMRVYCEKWCEFKPEKQFLTQADFREFVKSMTEEECEELRLACVWMKDHGHKDELVRTIALCFLGHGNIEDA